MFGGLKREPVGHSVAKEGMGIVEGARMRCAQNEFTRQVLWP
jgi:hypothetical protein